MTLFPISMDVDDAHAVVIDTMNGWPPSGPPPGQTNVSDHIVAAKSTDGASSYVYNMLLAFDTAPLTNDDPIEYAYVEMALVSVMSTNGKSVVADFFNWKGIGGAAYSFPAVSGAIVPKTIASLAVYPDRVRFDIADLSGINVMGYTQLRFHITDDSMPSGMNEIISYAKDEEASVGFRAPILGVCTSNAPVATPNATATMGAMGTATPTVQIQSVPQYVRNPLMSATPTNTMATPTRTGTGTPTRTASVTSTPVFTATGTINTPTPEPTYTVPPIPAGHVTRPWVFQ